MVLLCTNAEGQDGNAEEYPRFAREVDESTSLLRCGNPKAAEQRLLALEERWKKSNLGGKDRRRHHMGLVLYLRAFAHYQLGENQEALEAFERAVVFERDHDVCTLIHADVKFFIDCVVLLANLIGSKEELQIHPMTVSRFSRYRSDDLQTADLDGSGSASFVAIFRSSGIAKCQAEDSDGSHAECSTVVLCQRGLDGLFRPTTVHVPNAKYHRLLIEKDEHGRDHIILWRTYRSVPAGEARAKERIVLALSANGSLMIESRGTGVSGDTH